MPVLDFKEIPEAHIPNGKQDKWEQFAEEFLLRLGFQVLEGPSRGVDGGKDLIVLGPASDGSGRSIRWLVSCKHNAHSGRSVSISIEKDIRDRVDAHSCQGFIGFYSTLASSGLDNKLKSLRSSICTRVIHSEHIEAELLRNTDDLILAKRYFPESLDNWLHNKQSATSIHNAFEPKSGTFTLPVDAKVMAMGEDELALLLERAALQHRAERPVYIKVVSSYLNELSVRSRKLKAKGNSSLDVQQEILWIDEDIFDEKQRIQKIKTACEQVFTPSVLIESLYMIGVNYKYRARILARAIELISSENWPDRYKGGAYIEASSQEPDAATMSAKVSLNEEQTQYLISRSHVSKVEHLLIPGAAEVVGLPTDIIVEEVAPRVLAKYAAEKNRKRKDGPPIKEAWLNVGDWSVGLA